MRKALTPKNSKAELPHTHFPKGVETDFVTRFTNLICGGGGFPGISDAPRQFVEAGALYLISTCAGPHVYMMSAIEEPLFSTSDLLGGLPLNVWFCIFGKTRVSRKTTVVSKLEEVIDELLPERFKLSQIWTPEKLAEELANAYDESEQACVATWIWDESAVFFEGLSSVDYMKRADSLLCKVYDGKTFSWGTIKRGKIYIRRPYLTVFLASTEDTPEHFPESLITKGFLNRFVVLHGERLDYKPRRMMLTDEEKQEAAELKEWLKALRAVPLGLAMKFDAEAWKEYLDFERSIEDKIKTEDLGLMEGFYGNLPTLAMKFSALYCLSRLSVEQLEKAKYLLVGLHDLNRALQWLRQAEEGFRWLAKTIEKGEKEKRRKTEKTKAEIDRILLGLLSTGEKTTTEITRYMLNHEDISADTTRKHLEALVNSGQVEMEVRRTGNPGRPPIIWRLSGSH